MEVRMIDWQRVDELRDEIGAEDFTEVVDLFLEEVDEVVHRLRTAPDPTRYEDDLHVVKGSALNLGFQSIAMFCAVGEKLAASGGGGTVDIAGVIASYGASKSEFLAKIEMPDAA